MNTLGFVPTKLQSMRAEFHRRGGHIPELKAYLRQIDPATVGCIGEAVRTWLTPEVIVMSLAAFDRKVLA